MFRKILSAAALLLTLPVFANAANWYVVAKSSPVTGQGTISPAGTVTYTTQTSGAFTVTPAANYTLTKLTLDNVDVTASATLAGGVYSYSVPKSAATFRYLTAYFATNYVKITVAAPTGGWITEKDGKSLTAIPAGSSRTLVFTPLFGYSISAAGITAAGATVTDNGDGTFSAAYTNLQANQSVSGTFTLVPTATVDAGPDVGGGTTAATAGKLWGSGTCNVGAPVFAWSGPAELNFGSAGSATTTVWSSTASKTPYIATLSVTCGTLVVTDTANVTITSDKDTQVALCTACHATSTPTEVAKYFASGHYAITFEAITCQTCHTTATDTHHVADPTGICRTCHTGGYSQHLGATVSCAVCHDPHEPNAGEGGPLTEVLPPHFGGALTASSQFLAYGANCYNCHVDTLSSGAVAGTTGTTVFTTITYGSAGPVTTWSTVNYGSNGTILGQYAESAHGDVLGAAWVSGGSHDWPTSATCRDCHSTIGYAEKWTNGQTYRTVGTGQIGQTLACDACHDNIQTGTLRAGQTTGQTVVAVQQGYGSTGPRAYTKTKTYNSTAKTWSTTTSYTTYPSVGQSNTCISCHQGRENGESILTLTDAGMTKASFKNPHYLGAAGMMYAKLAFIDFTDRTKSYTTGSSGQTMMYYGSSMTANEDGGALTSTHRKLGTSDISSDTHLNQYGNKTAKYMTTGGPCVTCHMGRGVVGNSDGTYALVDGKNHSWDIGADSVKNVCINCHSSEASDVTSLDTFLEEQAIPFNNAIAVAEALLKSKYNITYSEAYPYWYDNNLTPAAAVADWTRGRTLSGADAKKLMGVCLNIKLVKTDAAAYVHARSYARRMLFDTIDWLDDMQMNMSSAATAMSLDPNNYGYFLPTDASGASESLKYLKAYDRTLLMWYTNARP